MIASEATAEGEIHLNTRLPPLIDYHAAMPFGKGRHQHLILSGIVRIARTVRIMALCPNLPKWTLGRPCRAGLCFKESRQQNQYSRGLKVRYFYLQEITLDG